MKQSKIDLSIDISGKSKPKDPFASVKQTGKIQSDYPAETSAMLRHLKESRKAEAKRMRLATDSEFWCAFVFQTREQKESFLAQLKLSIIGDKYIDGKIAAKILGINLPKEEPSYQGEKVARRLVSEIGTIGGD